MVKRQFNLTDHLLELFDTFKHERKGVLFFSFLIILVLTFHFSMDYLVEAPNINTHQLDSLIAESVEVSNTSVPGKSNVKPKTIDPNTAGKIGWMQLGFSEKQVKSILNYRSAIGGKFKDIKHIQKIYIIDSFKFSKIKPYLSIETHGMLDSVASVTPSWKTSKRVKKESRTSLFVFDPNKISYDSLLLLGFHSKQASSLIKYREKIEYFGSSTDLLKLYLYNESDHKKYAFYVQIDAEYLELFSKNNSLKTFENEIIELNTADTAQLMQIRGVGPYYAAKIIQYRNALGGYFDKKQLYEIKKIPKERMDIIIKSVFTDGKQVKKISINNCEFKELLAHPYFDYYETKLLFDYRNEHVKFIYLQDLKKTGPLPDSYINKVGHYLIFD